MGLPEIIIDFRSKGKTAVQRSARGIVACILRDNTVPELENKMTVYNSIVDIEYTKWTEKNYQYLKLVFMGGPYRVLVYRMAEDATGYADALKALRDLRWNYLTIPQIKPDELALVSAWIKEQREQYNKTFKVVLPNMVGDHEGIINLTTDNFKVSDGENVTEFSRAEYCARLAGLFAGLPLSRSSTYFVLTELVGADVPDDPGERIDKGELVVVFDSENYKIGRGVNSFTSFSKTKGKDLSKIKIVEGKDMYNDDLRTTYEQNYVGKVINDYDAKQALIAVINTYHKELEGDVLNQSFENKAKIDTEAQRAYLEDAGIDTSDMTDQEIDRADTGTFVFVDSNIKFVDAIEDVHHRVNM